MKIEILGAGCPRCKALYENARKAVQEAGLEADIVKVENIDKIIAYGVMLTPALVIDGEVKVSGKVPLPEEIRAWLKK